MQRRHKKIFFVGLLLFTVGWLVQHYLGPEIKSSYRYLKGDTERERTAALYRGLRQGNDDPTEPEPAAQKREVNPSLLDDVLTALDWLTDQMLESEGQATPPPIEMQMTSQNDFTLQFNHRVTAELKPVESTDGTLTIHFDESTIDCEVSMISWQKSPLTKRDVPVEYRPLKCGGTIDRTTGEFEINGQTGDPEGRPEPVTILGTLTDGKIFGTLLFRGATIALKTE
jgi:hypothetical protein